MMSMAHRREVWSRCHSRRKHRLGDVRRAHAQYDRIDVETADDRRAAATRICDAPSALEKVFQTVLTALDGVGLSHVTDNDYTRVDTCTLQKEFNGIG